MIGSTFKPLSRKRYRCVQTRAVVTQGQLEGYRRQLFFRDHKPPPPIAPQLQLPTVTAYASFVSSRLREAMCPECRKFNLVEKAGPHQCTQCGSRFNVTFPAKHGADGFDW